MRKTVLFMAISFLLTGCATGQKIQQKADASFEKEMKIWDKITVLAKDECPKEVSRRTQIIREACAQRLIKEHFQPYVSYPALVDNMLTQTGAEAKKYADGKISKATYRENVNRIAQEYWIDWQKAWDAKIASAYADEDNNRVFGQMLLGGIQGYNQGAAKRREEAASHKTLYCSTNAGSTICNEL